MRFEPLFKTPSPSTADTHTSRYGRHHKRASCYSYLLEHCEESKAKQARPKRPLVLFMHPGVQYYGYSQRSSTLNTARVLYSGYSQGSNTLDKARGSGSGYSKGSSTEDTTRGSVLWIQPGILALNAVRGSVLYCRNSMGSWLWTQQVLALDTGRGPVLWIQKGAQYCGYSKGFSTLDTARDSGSGYSQEVSNTLDKASGSGCGYSQWFWLWIQQEVQYSGYSHRFSNQDTAKVSDSGYSHRFWLWIQQGVAVDKARGSVPRFSKGFSTLDTTRSSGSGSNHGLGIHQLGIYLVI